MTLTISCWEWTRFSVIQGDNVERRDTKRIIIIFSQILNAVGVVQSGFYYSVVSLICIHNYCSLVYWLECKAAWEPLLQQKSFWLSQFLVEDGIQGDTIEMSSTEKVIFKFKFWMEFARFNFLLWWFLPLVCIHTYWQ